MKNIVSIFLIFSLLVSCSHNSPQKQNNILDDKQEVAKSELENSLISDDNSNNDIENNLVDNSGLSSNDLSYQVEQEKSQELSGNNENPDPIVHNTNSDDAWEENIEIENSASENSISNSNVELDIVSENLSESSGDIEPISFSNNDLVSNENSSWNVEKTEDVPSENESFGEESLYEEFDETSEEFEETMDFSNDFPQEETLEKSAAKEPQPIPEPESQKNPYEEWTKAYGNLLAKYLSEDSVSGVETVVIDYPSLSADPQMSTLNNELANLPSFTNEDEKVRLALWINAYNFLTIYRISQNPGIKQFNDLEKNGLNVWKQPAGKVAGRSVTLDGIEHDIIRKEFREPRIHFALVCAAVGCPDLLDEPYTAEKLEQQLEAQFKKYVANNNKGMSVQGNTLYLSEIFSWFAADFDGNAKNWLLKKGVISSSVAQYSVRYIPYDWSLNTILFTDKAIRGFKVDQDKSLLAIVTHKAGLASGLAHDHMIYATTFESSLTANPNFLNSVSFSAKIPVEKLYTDLYKLQQIWYPRLKELDIQTREFTEISSSDRKTIRENMFETGQLDVKNYAHVEAKVLKVIDKNTKVGQYTFDKVITLDVTIKGKKVTRDIPGRIYIEDNVFRVETVGKYKFTDFGITPYSAFFGALRNSDDFYLYVNLQAK